MVSTDTAAQGKAVPDKDQRWLWALFEEGELDAVRRMYPPNFDWSSLHPDNDTTPLQVVVGGCVQPENQDKKAFLDLAAWMIEQGADPTVKAPRSCCYEVELWLDDDKENTQVLVPCADESALTLAISLRRELKGQMEKLGNNDWQEEVGYMSEMVTVLTRSASTRRRHMQTVDSNVVSIWDRMQHDTASHDVLLETSTGNVGAHAALLSSASPVLAAMISSDFLEGRKKCIAAQEVSRAAVELLLDLAYTGTTCSDLDYPTVLAAIDLAHRWQVNSVVTMLEDELQTLLSDDSFAGIAECAQLKGLQALKSACRSYAFGSDKVQDQLRSRRLPPAALELLGASCSFGPDGRRAKRRRSV